MNKEDNVTSIKGVGEKTAGYLEKLNIITIEDLLYHFPLHYEKLPEVVSCPSTSDGSHVAIRGRIMDGISQKHVRNLTITTFSVADGNSICNLTYFNMPYLRKTLKPGNEYIFKGIIKHGKTRFSMDQPKIYKIEDYEKLKKTLQPRYHLTRGLKNQMVSKTIDKLFGEAELIEEELCPEIIDKRKLLSKWEAIKKIHRPKDEEELKQAKDRLCYEELLEFYIRMKESGVLVEKKSDYKMIPVAQTIRFIEKLPYRLTKDQKATWQEIVQDLESGIVMNRLVQGDVGSGKTIIAFLALLMTVCNGYQGALMAPTEVLASQHMDNLLKLIKEYDLPIKPVFLSGQTSKKDKTEAYKKLASGEANVAIGTHALISEGVTFKNLALVITDEQHRFGVKQRSELADKGIEPHILVMSATPIPRTLAILLNADLHISVIKTMPDERVPIKSAVVDTSYRNTAYNFIKKEIAQGHQCYVICPMVEPDEDSALENVEDYTKKLKKEMPEYRIEKLHGQMKASEKNRIMESFAEHNIDILVSTTVIEVGINVPNATVMMVENAERFGLATLHQLRGRVGRGDQASYCIFVNGSSKNEENERLKIITQNRDGFAIAAKDLELRGPGDVLGLRQSGDFGFNMVDIYKDVEWIEAANEDAQYVMENCPKFIAGLDRHESYSI